MSAPKTTLQQILGGVRKHEDDAPKLPAAPECDGTVLGHVCDSSPVLSPRGAAELGLDENEGGTVTPTAPSAPPEQEDVETRIKVFSNKQPKETGHEVCTEVHDFEQQMADFEREYASLNLACVAADDNNTQQQPHHAAVHAAYGELYNAAPADMLSRMKVAMQGIPEVCVFSLLCSVHPRTTSLTWHCEITGGLWARRLSGVPLPKAALHTPGHAGVPVHPQRGHPHAPAAQH
jgi:hypothetical protein